MTQIFVIAADTHRGRSRLAVSVEQAIPRQKVLENFKPEHHSALAALETEFEGFYAWGLNPGKRNVLNWKLLKRQDIVLVTSESKYVYKMRVAGKFYNEAFAEALWGRADKDIAFGQFAIFLSKPTPVSVPLESASDALYRSYIGFTRISDSAIESIEKRYDSVEEFVRVRFPALTTPSAPPPVRAAQAPAKSKSRTSDTSAATQASAADRDTWWTLFLAALLMVAPLLSTGDAGYLASLALFLLPWLYLTFRQMGSRKPPR